MASPDGSLIAVTLTDRCASGLSGVYKFFDPDEGRRSLGSLIVLWHVARARELRLPYVYLGYWIAGSVKMAYKARFRPLEQLTPDGWRAMPDGPGRAGARAVCASGQGRGGQRGLKRPVSRSELAQSAVLGLETGRQQPQLSAMPAILILNGPNLNLLGRREPGIYGRATLADIEAMCAEEGARLGLAVTCRQSNSEGELVTWVQEVHGNFAGLIINAGAYSHTSIALLDAARSLDEPLIEVHLSNIYKRESFRQHSYISLAATGVLCGFGASGYLMALRAMADLVAAADS